MSAGFTQNKIVAMYQNPLYLSKGDNYLGEAPQSSGIVCRHIFSSKMSDVEYLSFSSHPRTGSPSERVVWNPDVHTERFGETCYYLIIRIKKPEGHIGESIRNLLGTARIQAACIYELYGYFDVLVRFWATAFKYKWLLEGLSASSNLIEEYSVFHVKHISYKGVRNDHFTIDQIFKFDETIRLLSEADERDGRFEIDSRAQYLLDNNLIWRFKKISGEYFKFYIALDRVGPVKSQSNIRNSINHFLSSNSRALDLHNVAVYEGEGFADFLVKVVVKKYKHIWRCIETMLVSEYFKDVRPTTYLIASADIESDAVDYEYTELDVSMLMIVSCLGSRYVQLAQKLTPTQTIPLSNLFKTYARFKDSDFEDVFLGLFRAFLEGNSVELSKSLSFLQHIEVLILDFLTRTAIEVLGKEYWPIMQATLNSCRIGETNRKTNQWEIKRPENLTLHDSVLVLGKLYKDSPALKAEAEKVVTSDELDAIRNVIEIRNALSHGRIYKDKTYVTSGWEPLAWQVFGIGDAYIRLLRWEAAHRI